MELRQPTILTDGGPWADHDQACAVCHIAKAVIDVGTGIFQPCWGCQSKGYMLTWRRRRFRKKWPIRIYARDLDKPGFDSQPSRQAPAGRQP